MRDEVAQTLQQNSVSAEFFKDRVKEVIEASLASEKEMRIDQLLQDNMQLQSQITDKQIMLQSLQSYRNPVLQ